MRINNNITAMNTHRQYTVNNNNISKSAEKLSSGYRVNRAGDDAAGLAISEKMRAQIRGLNMASKNSQDGNSLIQTAEGALQEVHSILQRMNELAVQSATGTNQNLDRNALDQEFQQLKAEINDISQQTTFNDMQLLNGDFQNVYIVAGDGALGITDVATVLSGYNVSENLSVSLEFKDGASGERTLDVTIDGQTVTLDLTTITTGISWTATGPTLADTASFTIDLSNIQIGDDVYDLGELTITNETGAPITNAAEFEVGDFFATGAKTLTFAFDAAASNPLMIQVGAKEGNLMSVGIDLVDTSARSLNLDTHNIASQATAGNAITQTRRAINRVSKIRSALGAAQNRLEHKIANLDNQAENLQAAESRIRDVDMASEMTNFTKNSILSQAATAMLAQANALPQNVLQLLR